MDATAIIKLQSLAIAGLERNLETDTPVILLPAANGSCVVESLEPFMDQRSRFRGTMTTNSVADFVKYVVARKGSPSGFIDATLVSKMDAVVFFNLGDDEYPGHADDTAVLTPKMLAAFASLQKINAQKFTQRDLIDWIEDWSHVLSARCNTDGDEEPMGLAHAIAGIRDMKIVKKGEVNSNQGDMKVSRSAMDEIAAQSNKVMPTRLVMTTAPFDGFSERDFHLRIAVLTGEGDPRLTLRWIGQERQCEEIAQEFKQILTRDLGGLADSLVLGSFNKGK